MKQLFFTLSILMTMSMTMSAQQGKSSNKKSIFTEKEANVKKETVTNIEGKVNTLQKEKSHNENLNDPKNSHTNLATTNDEEKEKRIEKKRKKKYLTLPPPL